MPAWQNSLTLKQTTFWGNANDSGNGATSRTFSVDLPADVRALTTAFLADFDEAPHQPTLRPEYAENGGMKQIVLQAGQAGQIIVRGQDLWRNPTVFVGNQQASRLEVLPDMAGLLVSFDTVQGIPHSGSAGAQVDLAVVTSGGMATLHNAVTVLPASEQRQQLLASAKLNKAFTIGNDGISISLDRGAVPQGCYSIALRVLPGDWLSTSADASSYVISMPCDISMTDPTQIIAKPAAVATLPDWWNGTARLVNADLQVRLTAHDDPVSILKGGRQTFVHFTDASQSKPTLVTSTSQIQFDANGHRKQLTNTLDISFGTNSGLLFQAYPTLQQYTDGTTQLLLVRDGTASASWQGNFISRKDRDTGVYHLDLAPLDGLSAAMLPDPAGGTASATVKILYQSQDGQPQQLEVTGSLMMNRDPKPK